MIYKISFQEMARLAMAQLSRQSPSTLEEKREQYRAMKNQSKIQLKKK